MWRIKWVLVCIFPALFAVVTAFGQVVRPPSLPAGDSLSISISLHLAKADVRELFDTLERMTNIRFSYVVGIEKYGPVRVWVDHASIDNVLHQALDRLDLDYRLLCGRNMPLRAVVFPRHRPDTLKGVYVTLPNDTLMPNYNNGYDQVKATGSVGSFETVSNQLLDRVVDPDVVAHLDGQLSGITAGGPENSLGFSIRGNSTLLGPGTPLLVLGSFPYSGNIGDINVYDLQSATVLKDAAAAGVWGAYSGNGVVVLTPRVGEYSKRPMVTLTENITMTQKPALSYRQQMSPASYIHADSVLFNNHFFDGYVADPFFVLPPSVELMYKEQQGEVSPAAAGAGIAAMSSHNINTDLDHYYYRSAVMREYHASLEGGSYLSKYYVSGGYDYDPTVLIRNSYERSTLFGSYTRRSVDRRLMAGFSGGLAAVNSQNNNSGDVPVTYPYAALADGAGHPLPVAYGVNPLFADTAAGYPLDWHYRPLQELALADNRTGRRNFWLQGSVSYLAFSGLGFELSGRWMSGHSYARDQNNSADFYVRSLVNNFSQVQDGNYVLPVPDGNILDAADTNYSTYNLRASLKYNGDGAAGQWTVRAGAEVDDVEARGQTKRLYGYTGSGSVPMDLVDYFPIRLYGFSVPIPDNNAVGELSDRAVSLFSNAAFAWRRTYNFYAAVRLDASNIVGVPNDQKWSPFWSVGLSRAIRLGRRTEVGSRAASVSGARDTAGSAGVAGGAYKVVSGWQVVDHGTSGIQVNDLVISNAGAEDAATVRAGRKRWDGGRWPSLLNMRLSYGCNGNVSNRTAALVTQDLGTNTYGAAQSGIAGTPDPTLSWERVYILNAGTDLEFFRGELYPHGRLSGSLDVYGRRAVNLLSDVELAPSSGVSQVYIGNGAAIMGQGIDVTLRSVNMVDVWRKFRWTSTLLLGANRDWISSYRFFPATPSSYVTDGIMRQGSPSTALFSYSWAGLDPRTGDPQGLLAGQPSKNYGALTLEPQGGVAYSGVWQPVVTASLLNDFSLGRWDLSIRLDCRTGYVFRRPSIGYYFLAENYDRGTKDYDSRWQYPGQATQVPSQPVSPDPFRDLFYQNSEVLITRADNIRWRDVKISYGWTPRTGPVKSAIVYAYVNNIGLLWKANRYGIDPDAAGYGQLPAPRTYTIGARCKF